jgi:hypothetical protein
MGSAGTGETQKGTADWPVEFFFFVQHCPDLVSKRFAFLVRA